MSDESMFEEIFQSFRDKFPPASSLDEATLRLSTTEITETMQDFWPEIPFPRTGITRFLIEQGYKYEPMEVNERIRYFWLIGNK